MSRSLYRNRTSILRKIFSLILASITFHREEHLTSNEKVLDSIDPRLGSDFFGVFLIFLVPSLNMFLSRYEFQGDDHT